MENLSCAWAKTKNLWINRVQKICSGQDRKKKNLRSRRENAYATAASFNKTIKLHVKTELRTCYILHHYCGRMLLKLFKWRCLILFIATFVTLAAPWPNGSAIQVHEPWPAVTAYAARPAGNGCARNLSCCTIGHPYVSRLARHMQRISRNSSGLSS